MEKGSFGQILALVGFILLLLTGVGRQQARRRQQQPSPRFQRWQNLGTLAAFALIIIGLILMATAQ
jgi:threonine/homoserine/homoserine lactone efflux protein